MFVAKSILMTTISVIAVSAAELAPIDSQSILQLVRSNRSANEIISNNYVCTAKSIVHLVDGDGRELNKGNEFESIAVPHNNTLLWKTVKINGKDVSEKMKSEEESLIRSQIESSEKPADKFWGFPSITKIMETCKIRIKGREARSGRSVLVIKFDTSKSIYENDHMATFASNLKGRFLIDEGNGQLVEFQSEVVNDIELLANNKLKLTAVTNFAREYQFVDNRMWLPIKSVLRNPLGNILNRKYLEKLTRFVDYRHFEIGEIALGHASK